MQRLHQHSNRQIHPLRRCEDESATADRERCGSMRFGFIRFDRHSHAKSLRDSGFVFKRASRGRARSAVASK